MSETWIIRKNPYPRFIYITTANAGIGEEIAVIYSGNMEHAHLVKAAPKMRDALREAERFMEYFSGEKDIFVGPGTPDKCLVQIRQALAEAYGETE